MLSTVISFFAIHTWRVLLVVVLFCCVVQGGSQVVLFKDHSTGFFGLKDSNRIVLPASYSNIEKWKAEKDTCSSFISGFLITKNKKKGIAGSDGKIIIPPTYDEIEKQCSAFGLIRVVRNGSVGFLNSQLKLIVPANYDTYPYVAASDRIVVSKGELTGIMNFRNEMIVPLSKGRFFVFGAGDSLCFFLQYGTSGILYDVNGKTVIPHHEVLMSNYAFDILIARKDSLWGVYSKSGELIIPFMYEELQFKYKCNTLLFKQKGKWGMISQKGEQLVPAQYDQLSNYYEEMYINTISNRKHGIISCGGQEIISPQYEERISTDQLRKYKNAIVKLNGKYGVVSASGKIICEPVYDRINFEDVIQVWKNGKTGILNYEGKVMIQPLYDKLYWNPFKPWKWDYYLAENEELHGVLSRTGDTLVPLVYTWIERHSEKYPYRGELCGEYGILDEHWRFVFDEHKPNVQLERVIFDNSKITKIENEGQKKYGIFDSTGKQIGSALYDYIKFYDGQYAVVEIGNEYTLINRQGEEILIDCYRNIELYSKELFRVYNGSHYGLIRRDGSSVLEVECKAIYRNDKLKLKTKEKQPALIFIRRDNGKNYKDRRYGLMKENGEKFTEIIYEEIKLEEKKPSLFLREGNWYFLDEKGKEIGPATITSRARKAKYDYISYRGKINYPEQKCYYASLNGKHGLVDFYDSLILPFIFDTIYSYDGEFGVVKAYGKSAVVDKYGNFVVMPEFDSTILKGVNIYLGKPVRGYSVREFNEEYNGIVIMQNGKYGLHSLDGKKITEPIYDAFETNWPNIVFEREGKWLVVDANGKEYPRPGTMQIIPCWDCSDITVWDWDGKGRGSRLGRVY